MARFPVPFSRSRLDHLQVHRAVPRNAQSVDLPLAARGTDTTLFRWLYDEIRMAIVQGRLRPGTRLPSSRGIARQYKVARGTVVAAFEQLAAEGYVECVVGSDTLIKTILPEAMLEAKPLRASNRAEISKAGLSSRGRRRAGRPGPGRRAGG